jgi:hypothetical protein
MDDTYGMLDGVLGDSSGIIIAALVFTATAILAFGIMAGFQVRGAVRRRAAGIAEFSDPKNTSDKRSVRHSSM